MTPERLTALEALLGLALVVAGVAMVHVPAAFVLAGAALFGVAVWPALKRRRP